MRHQIRNAWILLFLIFTVLIVGLSTLVQQISIVGILTALFMAAVCACILSGLYYLIIKLVLFIRNRAGTTGEETIKYILTGAVFTNSMIFIGLLVYPLVFFAIIYILPLIFFDSAFKLGNALVDQQIVDVTALGFYVSVPFWTLVGGCLGFIYSKIKKSKSVKVSP